MRARPRRALKPRYETYKRITNINIIMTLAIIRFAKEMVKKKQTKKTLSELDNGSDLTSRARVE